MIAMLLPSRFLLPALSARRCLLRARRRPCCTTSADSYVDPQPAAADKIFVAMSSGVDSTVTATLLLAGGHPVENIIPIHMSNWAPLQHAPTPIAPSLLRGPYGKRPLVARPQPPQPQKCVDAEFSRVQALCKHLGLRAPTQLSLERDYWHAVFAPMLESYAAGATPNPDVSCNRHIKFGPPLFSQLDALAAGDGGGGSGGSGRHWWLATGHYARVAVHARTGEHHLLRTPAARAKDQSYFLSTIPRASLDRLLFPLGAGPGWSKPDVKARARALDIPGWRAHDPQVRESMGLCFIEPSLGAGRRFRDFLADYLEPDPGNVVAAATGDVVGRHEGLWHATVGAKSKLELPQGDPRWKGRWYVVGKSREKNEIYVARGDDSRLWSRGMYVAGWCSLATDREEVMGFGHHGAKQLWAAYRHSLPVAVKRWARVAKDMVWVEFAEAQRAVADGQAAAVWVGERCMGGGVITAVEPEKCPMALPHG